MRKNKWIKRSLHLKKETKYTMTRITKPLSNFHLWHLSFIVALRILLLWFKLSFITCKNNLLLRSLLAPVAIRVWFRKCVSVWLDHRETKLILATHDHLILCWECCILSLHSLPCLSQDSQRHGGKQRILIHSNSDFRVYQPHQQGKGYFNKMGIVLQ